MTTYRLFYLGAQNHIVGSFEYLAENDSEALVIAEAHRDARSAELWCGVRPISTFPPKLDAD